MVVLEILVSVFIVSLISFVGALALILKEKFLRRILPLMISFAAGGLLGAAFLDLIPEALESLSVTTAMIAVLFGVITFFVFEKFLYWYHCHFHKLCDVHVIRKKSLPYLNLVGDSVHNFVDGMIIAASYLTNIGLGVVTTIAVIFHEIPQEIGDVGILLYSGLSRWKVLMYNFLTALASVLGAVVVIALASTGTLTGYIVYLIPFAAGGFIYIAGSDLIPELHQETGAKKSLVQLTFLILGIATIFIIGVVFPGMG